jgi:hypothetical protein
VAVLAAGWERERDGAAVNSDPAAAPAAWERRREQRAQGIGRARTRSSGFVRRVAAARLDSHGGEARSEEWLTEELEVAMAERRLRRTSS